MGKQRRKIFVDENGALAMEQSPGENNVLVNKNTPHLAQTIGQVGIDAPTMDIVQNPNTQPKHPQPPHPTYQPKHPEIRHQNH